MISNLDEDCSCSIAATGGLGGAHNDLAQAAASLDPQAKAELYKFIRENCCRPESEWRMDFSKRFGIPESELPQLLGKNAEQLLLSCVARHISESDNDTKKKLSNWQLISRRIETGIGETNLVFDARNGLGIAFSPFGSFESEHKWGALSEIHSSVAFDHVWCETLEQCCKQLEKLTKEQRA
jgi:hypothetical protein